MRKMNSNKIFEKITELYLFLIITVFLLSFSLNGYSEIHEVKFTVFVVLCGGYVIICGLLFFQLLLIGEVKFSSIKNTWQFLNIPQIAILAYILFTWISALSSSFYPQTIIGVSRMEGAVTLSIYCISFLLVSAYGKITEKIISVFSATTLCMNVLAIIQLYGFNPLNLFPNQTNYYDAYEKYNSQFLSTIGNVDMFASFLCLSIPIIGIYLIYKIKHSNVWMVLTLFSSIFVLCKMLVLSSFVGILTGIIVVLPIILKLKNSHVLFYVSITIVFIVLCLIIIYFSDVTEGVFFEINQMMHGVIKGEFGSGRIHIWSSIIKLIPENLWFGTGPDTMLNAKIPAFIRYDVENNGTIVTLVDTAHNEYLNIWFHQGFFALLSYLTCIICLIMQWIKKSRNNIYITMLGCSIFCYSIQIFFSFSSFIISPLFWIFLALLTNQVYYRK